MTRQKKLIIEATRTIAFGRDAGYPETVTLKANTVEELARILKQYPDAKVYEAVEITPARIEKLKKEGLAAIAENERNEELARIERDIENLQKRKEELYDKNK